MDITNAYVGTKKISLYLGDKELVRAVTGDVPLPNPAPLVSVYSGMTSTSDDPFVTYLGPALTSGTSYYTGSAYSGGNFNLVLLDQQRTARDAAIFATYSASNGAPYTDWADVASGLYDAHFTALATKLAGCPAGTSFSFANEPETRVAQGNQNANGKNDPDDFAAAFRRTVEVMRPICPDVDFRWWIAGSKRDATMEAYYPGDDYVDSIGYDPYIWSWDAANTHPATKFAGCATWLRSRSWGQGKPIGLSETGFDVSVHGDAAAATFWSRMPQTMKDLDLKFVNFFNRGEWTTTPGSTPRAWAAYVDAMQEISDM